MARHDTDPFDSPEWKAYSQRALEELVPMMRGSAVTISLAPKGDATDIKFALELGLSIMMDKPIIVVVFPDTTAPAKLLQFADRVVEGSYDDTVLHQRMAVALRQVLREAR